MRALHVLEVEDDGVLEEREEDEHDARQEPDLIRIDLGSKSTLPAVGLQLVAFSSTISIAYLGPGFLGL